MVYFKLFHGEFLYSDAYHPGGCCSCCSFCCPRKQTESASTEKGQRFVWGGETGGGWGEDFQIQILSERILDHLWPPVGFFRDPTKSGIIFLAQQGPFVRPNISPKVSGTKHTGTEPDSRLVWGWVFPCIAYTIQLVWGEYLHFARNVWRTLHHPKSWKPSVSPGDPFRPTIYFNE